LEAAKVCKYLILDGSFATAIESPNDVDVLLVLKDEVDLTKDVPPFEYNARSKSYVRKQYAMDLFVGFDGDASSQNIMEYFQLVRGRPDRSKGMLRVALD
jgi:hypothetical protein